MSRSKLCDTCQDTISVGPVRSDKDKEHHVDSEKFFAAVKQECYVCKWAWRSYSWSKFDGRDVYKPVHHTTYRWRFNVESSTKVFSDLWQLYLLINIHATEHHYTDLVIFWLVESSSAGISSLYNPDRRYKDVTTGTNLNLSLRSEGTFSLSRQWINECCSNHIECRVSTDPRKLPARLVCVRFTEMTSKLTAHICRGETLPICTQYLTLSHCWGKIKFLTTTRANLTSFELSLPIDSLSTTFQDALFTTANLGFQYIWIDSLCIVQDDPEDWKRESAVMHEIYKNASCNISASGSTEEEERFIPSERRFGPAPLPSQLVKNPLRTEDHGKLYYLIKTYPWKGFEDYSIFLRAWTLQEQLLVKSLSSLRRFFHSITQLTGAAHIIL
jgi:hypothetical protein